MPDAPAAPATPVAPAPNTKVVTFTKPAAVPKPTEPAGTDADPKTPAADVDPKDLWRKAVKGKTFTHKGAAKNLEELDPDEATEMIRRGYGASELVKEAKTKSEQAEQVLNLKKAIAEGDDEAALSAVWELAGERGLKLLDRLRGDMAKQQEQDATLTEKERAAIQRAAAAEQRAAELERAEQKRAKDAEEQSFKQEETRTKTEGLAKVGELMKVVKGFPQEKADVLLPFVARAWREAIETGAELGRDVKPEAIITRAEKLFRASTSDFYGKLSPTEQFEFLGEEAVMKLSNELVRRRRGAPSAAKAAPAAPKKTESTREAPQLGDPAYLRR